jgi:regulator of sigma E protease
MGTLQNITYFVIFLGVLVTVHEAGHFFAAKWAGVKVLKFSIGFGPKLFGFRRGETEYQVAVLPLGGFVQMAGMYEGESLDEEDEKRSFLKAPWWKRMIISSAGPAANLIFPIFALFFSVLGDHQIASSRIGWVEPGFPAALAGMRPGDVITSIDGRPVRAFEEIKPAIENLYDRSIAVTVKRDGQDVTLMMTPRKTVEHNQFERITRGLLGVSGTPRVASIGVPEGSVARAAGLQTFDRVLSINGALVRDELELARLIDVTPNPLTITVIRSDSRAVGSAEIIWPRLVTVTVDKLPNLSGLAALALESSDLYVWAVFPNSPAAKAGLKRGDRWVTFDGENVASWSFVANHLRAAEATPMQLSWRSDGELKTATVRQVSEDAFDELKNKFEVFEFGLRPRFGGGELLAAGPMAEEIVVHTSPKEALTKSVKQVPLAVQQVGSAIAKIFMREIPAEALGGPIMMFQVSAISAEQGVQKFLETMANVSINLGLVNLLPIPILDGFSLLSAAWEGIRRRPIHPKAREVANVIGFVMLAMMVVLVFKNDITKLLR